jgi:hypothetical protein
MSFKVADKAAFSFLWGKVLVKSDDKNFISFPTYIGSR